MAREPPVIAAKAHASHPGGQHAEDDQAGTEIQGGAVGVARRVEILAVEEFQEEAEAGNDKAQGHDGEPGAEPSEESALRREIHARIGGSGLSHQWGS
jgi:hypothetical protein